MGRRGGLLHSVARTYRDMKTLERASKDPMWLEMIWSTIKAFLIIVVLAVVFVLIAVSNDNKAHATQTAEAVFAQLSATAATDVPLMIGPAGTEAPPAATMGSNDYIPRTLTAVALSSSPTPLRIERTPTPAQCRIKGNVNSKGEKIYHCVNFPQYGRVVMKPEEGDRWFCTVGEAVAAGFRSGDAGRACVE